MLPRILSHSVSYVREWTSVRAQTRTNRQPVLPKPAQRCPRLPKSNQSCPKMPKTAQVEPRLTKAAQGCPKLPKAAQSYPRLSSAARGWLELTQKEKSNLLMIVKTPWSKMRTHWIFNDGICKGAHSTKKMKPAWAISEYPKVWKWKWALIAKKLI